MASRILAFPAESPAVRRGPAPYLTPSAASFPAAQLARDNEEASTGLRLRLVYSRPQTVPRSQAAYRSAENRTQAQRTALQVEQEIAHRVQREAAERYILYCLPPLAERRALASTLPCQATEIGLRQRLLDALLFFARPA